MGLHYLDKQRAVIRIGVELQRRGWELFGYDPGKSDSMTDYFRSASWDGIATHPDRPGIVVGVQVDEYIVNHRPGNDKGWPEFQATPKRRGWHIERDGEIIDTGIAYLEKCSRHDFDLWQAQVIDVVDAIESRITPPSVQKTSARVNQISVRYDRTWTWVQFPGKPAKPVRDRLRKMGGTFSSRRKAWYFRYTVPNKDLAWLFGEDETPGNSQDNDSKSIQENTMKPIAYYYFQKCDGMTWLHFPYASQDDKENLLSCDFSEYLLEGIELLDDVAQKNVTACSNEYVSIEQIQLAFPQWNIEPVGPAGYVPGQMSTYTYNPPWMDIPKLYSTQKQPNPPALIKLFTPDSSWTWYITEIDPDEELCFGLVVGLETELGYFSLDELREVTGSLGLHIERDKWFKPTSIRELAEYQAVWGNGGPYKGDPADPSSSQHAGDDVAAAMPIPDDIATAWNMLTFMRESLSDVMMSEYDDWSASLDGDIDTWRKGGSEPVWQGYRDDMDAICRDDGMPLLFDVPNATQPDSPDATNAPALDTPMLPAGWAEEDIRFLLEKLDANIPMLVADVKLGIPSVHDDFGAKTNHIGFGVMEVKGLHYTLVFDAGTSMSHTPSGRGCTAIQIEGEYPYDFNHVRQTLKTWLGENTDDKPKETISLTYGDNGEQVYFDDADYVLLNPYTDANRVRYAAGWTMHYKNLNDESVVPVSDPDKGEDAKIGGFSLAETVKDAERALNARIVLNDAPEDLPDAYPTITAEELEQVTAPQPEKLTRGAALAILDEAVAPQNNPAQTLTVDMLDAVERVGDAEIEPEPVFPKQLTGQAADDFLEDIAAIVPEMSGIGEEDRRASLGIPRGSLTVLYTVPDHDTVWSGDTRVFIEQGEESIRAAFDYLHDAAGYVRVMWGYTVLSVSKAYDDTTIVKVADDFPEESKQVGVFHEAWGDMELIVVSDKAIDVLAEVVRACYAEPDLPSTWNVKGIHLAAHIRSIFRAAYDLEKQEHGKVFYDELLEGYRQILEGGHGCLLNPVWNVHLWNPAKFIETAGLVDVIERKHWQYVLVDKRRLAKKLKGNASALVGALDKDPSEKRRNSILSELADIGELPDTYISAEKAGKPDDVIPIPETQAAPTESKAVDTASLEADIDIPPASLDAPDEPDMDVVTPTEPTDAPWSATPEDEAEYDTYSLELLTGMVRKRGAFHRALARITRSGALRVALTQINGDQRRRELIEKRLKKLEKAAPVASAA